MRHSRDRKLKGLSEMIEFQIKLLYLHIILARYGRVFTSNCKILIDVHEALKYINNLVHNLLSTNTKNNF